MIANKKHTRQFIDIKTIQNSDYFYPALKSKILTISIAFMLIGISGELAAQTNLAAEAKTDSTDKQAERNIFAENLTPKVKRSALLQKRPYNPIKKQDDQAQIPEIEMFVGESRVFPTPGVARIAVGNGSIMSAAALDNKEVLIFANEVGTSSLFVWNEDGRYQRVKINIVPGDTSRFAREIAAFLTTIPNAKASVIGDKVIVEGDNLSDFDLAKIDELAKRYPQIVNFTNRLGWEQMIFMDVKVVEFPSTELRDIGLKWSSLGGAVIGGIWQPLHRGSSGPYQINIQTGASNPPPITAPGGTGAVALPSGLNVLSAINLGLNAQLNLLAQDGKAAILAEPQLSARNGSKATFLAGGEFPYTVSSINGTTVQFKQYGIKLEIIPQVDSNGVIRAKIQSEVSTIDGSFSTQSGPGLLTRSTATEFNVRNGQTIVLSGLLSREKSTNIDKVPFLGDIPLLGALFRSTHFSNKQTELVVFVTPTVVDSHSPGLVDRIERTKERLQQNLGNQPYLTDPLQPDHDAAKVNQEPSKPQSASKHITAYDDDTSTQVKGTKESLEPVQTKAITKPASIKNVNSTPLTPSSQNPFQTSAQALPQPANREDALQVKLDGLVMRAEPSIKSQVLLQLGFGSVVLTGQQDTQPAGLGYWRNVRVGEINGWVASRWVSPIGKIPARANSESAIAQPDQQGQIISLGSSNDINTESNTNFSSKQFRVNLNRLALRVAPDINADVIQKLASGTKVESLQQAPKGHWMAVQADGKRGWVAAQWLVPEQ